MAYIRAKTVRDATYLYLVRSVWDGVKKTSRQEIIKYLGKRSDVTPDDIPAEYRNHDRVAAFFRQSGDDADANRIRDQLLGHMVAGDANAAAGICREYVKSLDLAGFYDLLLAPAMHRVGTLYERKKLSIADVQVASNMALGLISRARSRALPNRSKGLVLVCTPYGEDHHIGCAVLLSFLQSMGYRTMDMSPSAPSESVVRFVADKKPDMILVSVTHSDHVRACRRPVQKIRKISRVPILVGGQVIEGRGMSSTVTWRKCHPLTALTV